MIKIQDFLAKDEDYNSDEDSLNGWDYFANDAKEEQDGGIMPELVDYLRDIKNKKELIYPYLNIEYTQDVFSKIIERYNLEDSNYLVDLVYEAIIYEMNNHDK